jgi:hypothetical protein
VLTIVVSIMAWIFFNRLFDDIFSTDIMSDGRTTDELEKIWKEAVVA